MSIPSPQQYRITGQALCVDPIILKRATETVQRIAAKNSNIYPVLTLWHLSQLSGIHYGYLRKVVGRKIHPYTHFYLKKRTPGRNNVRMISVPSVPLARVQRWIVDNILRQVPPHMDSYAYSPGSKPIFAARIHTNSEWLLKIDIQDFFHAITEREVYRVFEGLGYPRLLSFEMARICTMACERPLMETGHQKREINMKIPYYKTILDGILPQGAPTSPMLSNLSVCNVDEQVSHLASSSNMRYTRYADDMNFSCSDRRERKEINQLKRSALEVLNNNGFRPNLRKTKVLGPGARKVVLGMLVDSESPRLTKEFKDNIRLHLHFVQHPDIGPHKHALNRKTSISRIYHHLFGLICWAKEVEPEYGARCLREFNSVPWPPVLRHHYFGGAGHSAE